MRFRRPPPRWGRGWLVLGLLLAAGGSLRALETPAVITTPGIFWNVGLADRDERHPVRMDMTVYYYDPVWKLLYGRAGGVDTYLPAGGRALPIRCGQRVRLTGEVIPADGFAGELIQVTVLADGQLPEPLPLAGQMEDLEALNGRWTLAEGYILSQNEPDATHVEARLWCDNRMVNLTVQISGTEPVPQLTGARVRVRGVYDVATDTSGEIQKIQMWTSRSDQIEVTGWLAEDERFKLVRTSIDRLGSVPGESWTKIVGQVKILEAGAGLIVEDETGQVAITTRQPGVPRAGTTVEVIGHAAPAAFGWTLQDPLFRVPPGQKEAVPPEGRPLLVPVRLRLAEQVLQLPPEEAEKQYPVTLRGVVTWSDSGSGRFYVQDVSGGVAVTRPQGDVPSFGETVSLDGVTQRGRFQAEVELRTIEQYGIQPLPPPRRISLEQAMTGAEEGRWVEMRGYVRQVVVDQGRTRIDLIAATGEFSAWLPAVEVSGGLVGALVRVRGICLSQPGDPRDVPGVRLWLQQPDAILTDEPSPADPFGVPLDTISGMSQLNLANTLSHRVRLQGTVLLHEPGRYLYFDDGTGGLFVLSRETGRLVPGSRVEIVGLPGRLGSRVVLREALWRPSSEGSEARPLRLAQPGALDPAADARLVQLQATFRQAVIEGGQARLTLQADGIRFDGTVHAAGDWTPPAEGSRLGLTGVYVLEFDEYRQPHAFRLELRTPADIVLEQAPPWWTVQRIWTVVGVLGLAMLLGFAWITGLRRQVRQQTEQIRSQLEKEARLQTELERSSRLESLGVLAGGIAHDFNNLLTAILGNLGLAAMDQRVMSAAGDCIAEAERGARRARDITQQLLTFAKGGDPVRAAVSLPEVVTEAANFARHGSNIRFDFDFPANLLPADVDAGQISRVVHNLVLNAVQAMPDGGVVNLSLAAATLPAGEVAALPAGEYLRLTIADTGKGMPTEQVARIFDPYYSTKLGVGNSGLGLATVRSIIRKHNGHIEVESRIGEGTTFRLWLPAADYEPPAVAGPGSRGEAYTPARILVMDDEDVIRRVAGRMLALAGHEAVFVADGAEAVRAYAAARQAGQTFDLVIFDLTVPGGMGGKEALQELLKLDPNIRAIASSGYASDPIMANPRHYGFRVSLPKPYDIPDLLKAVEEVRRF